MAMRLSWARSNATGAPMLRRGAWYPVLNEALDRRIVLGIGNRSVEVHRDFVQLRRGVPRGFSVVVRSPNDSNPVRGTARDIGPTYAVCPWSRTRVPFSGRPAYLKCPVCGHMDVVAWHPLC